MPNPFRVVYPDQPGPELTLAQVIDLYLGEKTLCCQSGEFSPKSLDRARYYLADFAAFSPAGQPLGELPAGQGDTADLRRWLIARPTWKARATKSAAVSQVISCFTWLAGEGYCRNPYTRPKFLGAPSRPRPAFTVDEYRAMLRACRSAVTPGGVPRRTRRAFRAALIFLWATGCRPSEMRAARWDEVDWDRAVLELGRHKTANETGETRLIPISRVLPLLRWLRRQRSPNQEKIFVNTLGRPWTCGTFAKEFRRYATAAGVRKTVSAYCLRHGLCSRLIEAGVPDRSIADVLGHTTTRYVSWYGRSTKSRADHLNSVLSRDRPQKG